MDSSGTYHQHGRISYLVVGTYVVLLLIVVLLLPGDTALTFSWAPWVLAALILLFLFRYLFTFYSIDDSFLRARRVLGGRRVPLSDIRKIEYSSLRELGPTGFFGSWGWRGRMWSPRIGRFDAIYTDAARGLLVTAGEVPLYITPVDLEGFARELSRRVRSYRGRLSVDVGDPLGSLGATEAA